MEYIDDQFGVVIKQAIRQIKEVDKGYTFFQNKDILFAKITPCMENGKCAIAKNGRDVYDWISRSKTCS